VIEIFFFFLFHTQQEFVCGKFFWDKNNFGKTGILSGHQKSQPNFEGGENSGKRIYPNGLSFYTPSQK
jgi:hypothetical protein